MIDKQQLDAELTAILPYLPGWQLDPKYARHTWCAVLRDGTGKGIHVNATQAKGRFRISGMWPFDASPSSKASRTSRCISASPATGRREDCRRSAKAFLPWYTAAYAEQVERAAQQDAAEPWQREVTVELAAYWGRMPRGRRQATRTRSTHPA